MLTAPAHITNAKPAVPGDAGATFPSGASADGFNGALAALMSQLGPPPPTPAPTASPRSPDRAASAGAASGTSSTFAPPPASSSAATGQAAASASAAGGDGASNAAAAAPSDGGQDGATSQGAPATAPGAQGAAQTAGGTAAATATQAGQLDPRLVPFVAKAGTAATTPGAAAAPTTTAAPTDPGAAGQDATAAGAADQAAASANAAAAGDPTADGAAASAALLSLVQPSQLTPVSGPAPQSAAAPAKSSKTVQLQAALSADTTETLTASPAAIVAKSAIADTAETQSDAALALPHDDNSQGAQTAQTSTDTSASGNQIAQQTTLVGAPAATINAPPAAAALVSSHGAEITAQLAAQISSRANAPRSAFDFALEPQGLGRVDVTLKFDSQGQLSAVLSFDNPNAAAEAKNRAGDLQQALQQAGFDVGQSGLSFTSSGGQGHGAASQAPTQTSYVNAPVLADTVAEAISPMTARGATGVGGLDITI